MAVVGVLVVVAFAGAFWVYRDTIVKHPGEHIAKAHIRGVIAQESAVLYRDGHQRIGVFFAREHRTYVPYKDIPSSWVSAIVAAEDKRFWDHVGFDVFGISRAMLRNIKAGRMVAGGSTLSQQTAKNLYYRPDRSLKSKWTELLNALRLEAAYSKQEILEFYANQFHVSSNGRGLGIAARYFFDKNITEIDTLESAFLAGMVKAPARYNPFIGATAEARSLARQRATERTHYVLGRMRDEGVLSASVYADLKARDLPFKKGRFQYESNVILDEVEARLAAAPFPELFESLNIDNPSTAGISIVTTLDEQAQRGATYALWHHLSEVGPLIEGGGVDAFGLDAGTPPRFDPSRSMAPGTFHRGLLVDGLEAAGLELRLPNGRCVLDKAAIQRAADIVARASGGNTWGKGKAKHRQAIEALVRKPTPVLVSIRSQDGTSPICDLEIRPKLQGGVILLEEGRIRAMVGGNDNRNFNRAIAARRQLGSIWKPVLYNAALQLGWSPTDIIDNRSNVFHFEGTWYYPRADHDNKDWVSLGWLGTRSENLGSIWLLTHLTDRLGPGQFELLAQSLGLTRSDDEEWMAYIRRIRDDEGVISTDARLSEMAFVAAKLEMVSTLGPQSEAGRALRSLFYGRGLEAEHARVVASGSRVAEKQTALDRSYRALAQRGTVCIADVNALLDTISDARGAMAAGVSDDEPVTPEDMPPPDMSLFSRLGVLDGAIQCGFDSRVHSPVNEALWMDWVMGLVRVPVTAKVEVAPGLSLGLMAQVHGAMKRRLLVWGSADPYGWNILQYHPDMRSLVGLRYMDKLARTFGVREALPPVLSMPLGAVDLSIEEAATLYQGLMDGQVWNFPGHTEAGAVPSPSHSTQLIAEIRDASGAILYRANPVPRPVIDPQAGRLVGDVLRNVVRWGTGRRALNAVSVAGVRVPLAGKTGTTNGYKNAAFAGFVPKFNNESWTWAKGYTLVTYVGYDDNTPMRRASVRLQGSNGALPVWVATAKALGAAGLLGVPTGAASPEWQIEEGLSRVAVVEGTGLSRPTAPEADGPDLDEAAPDGRSILVGRARHFSPVGMAAFVAVDLESMARVSRVEADPDTGLDAP
jgi:membrane peptidoglycan carboxypeptidase